MFKEYCLKHGTFIYPSRVHNPMYREVYDVFKKTATMKHLILHCKPYCKVGGGADKKAYQETISKPSFMMKDREKDRAIFVNGEVLEEKKSEGRTIPRIQMCLKTLHVEDQLAGEAMRYVIAKKT